MVFSIIAEDLCEWWSACVRMNANELASCPLSGIDGQGGYRYGCGLWGCGKTAVETVVCVAAKVDSKDGGW
jgi:hypothetical protein